jgi:hypothetical protein
MFPRIAWRRAFGGHFALAAAVWLILPGPGNFGRAVAGQGLVADTYVELDRVRDEKLVQLRQYLDRVQQLAQQAATDPVLGEFFRIRTRFHQLQAQQAPPAAAVAAVEKLELALREHYLTTYLPFYDILFVSSAGDVVHTIRGEADSGCNLFTAPWSETALVQRLRKSPGAAFVDYEHYEASGEPSAFFVEPVSVAGQPAGWLILQCTTDKLNRIFDRGEYLGATGEVFLVNRERLMLTDSRFRAETSILKQHLSAENIAAKFVEGRGHKIITDYRGQRALTSFEVCPVLGKEWLLIAKIDEDEVVTRAWNRRELEPMLMRSGALHQPVPASQPPEFPRSVRVDMDEFQSATPGAALLTWGVSTCTAVVIGRPGHFGYMGHLSTYDRSYGSGDIDVVAQMLKRIRQFEVYPSELSELRAVIVAPHGNSAHGVVDRLLEAGLFLSQITFVRDPDARRADVLHDPLAGTTWVHWFDPNGGDRWIDAAGAPDFGHLAQQALDYPAAVQGADTRGASGEAETHGGVSP